MSDVWPVDCGRAMRFAARGESLGSDAGQEVVVGVKAGLVGWPLRRAVFDRARSDIFASGAAYVVLTIAAVVMGGSTPWAETGTS